MKKFFILTVIFIFSAAILIGCGETEQPTIGTAPETTQPPATTEQPPVAPPAAEQPAQPPAVAEQPARPPAASEQQPAAEQQRAQNWIGMEVMGTNNQRLGTVSDVYLLDGNVRYVIIEGEGDRMHPVPVDQLREEGQSLIANFDQNMFQQAPSFSRTEEPRLAEAEWEQQIRGYYEGAGSGGSQQQSGQQQEAAPRK